MKLRRPNSDKWWFRWDEQTELQQLVNAAFDGEDTRKDVETIVAWFERTRLDRFNYHVEKARTAHDS